MALGSMSAQRRANRRAALDSFVVPDTLGRSPRRPGSVWAVAMMRNEADTADHVIRHFLDQGIDGVIVAENRSDDDTRRVLDSLAGELPVHVVDDPLSAMIQGAKVTELAQLARRAGADWIIPFDGDELWFAEGMSLAEFLRTCGADVVYADLHNVYPSVDDDADEIDPFLRLRLIDDTPFPVGKVAFRARRFMWVVDGNMFVTVRGRERTGLHIAHYPWRSLEHMQRKLRNGRRALDETNLDADIGVHWREGGTWTDEQLADAWREFQHGRPVENLSWSPIGSLLPLEPGRWSTWELHQGADA